MSVAKQSLEIQPALFAFVDRAGIDPTRNAAERAARQAWTFPREHRSGNI